MKSKKNTKPLDIIPDDAEKRTSLLVSGVVWNAGQRQMSRKGFNGNFSAYIADLIRRDEERELELDVLRYVSDSGKKGKTVSGRGVDELAVQAAAREIVRRATHKIVKKSHGGGARSHSSDQPSAQASGRAPESTSRVILGFRPAPVSPQS
jgi:hypothetical protein